jgi:hypothetical protein
LANTLTQIDDKYLSINITTRLEANVKPDTTTAMRQLIGEIRLAIPFDMPEASMCSDNCNMCTMKLLEYLDMEVMDWERRLDAGEIPNFGDISRLQKTGKKIYRALEKNGLVCAKASE